MIEMLKFVMDEIVAAADIVAVEAMSITAFFYEEAEATAEFVMGVAASMEAVLCRATALVEL
jgi:hypothetical protein